MTGLPLLEDELMHARVYDPVKAREYYLRTRHLKGRGRSGVDISSRPGGNGSLGGTGGSNSVLRDSREKSLDARIESLQAKADQLRALLRKRVDAAKGRAGVEKEPEKESSTSTKDTKTAKETKSDTSKDKPLTAKEKADKAKASKEQYEKENGTSKAREVEALVSTIKNLRERLAKLPTPTNNGQLQSGRLDKQDGGNGR